MSYMKREDIEETYRKSVQLRILVLHWYKIKRQFETNILKVDWEIAKIQIFFRKKNVFRLFLSPGLQKTYCGHRQLSIEYNNAKTNIFGKQFFLKKTYRQKCFFAKMCKIPSDIPWKFETNILKIDWEIAKILIFRTKTFSPFLRHQGSKNHFYGQKRVVDRAEV